MLLLFVFCVLWMYVMFVLVMLYNVMLFCVWVFVMKSVVGSVSNVNDWICFIVEFFCWLIGLMNW